MVEAHELFNIRPTHNIQLTANAAVEVWGYVIGEQSCVFLHRNGVLIHIINSSTSCEPHIMAFLRRLVLV